MSLNNQGTYNLPDLTVPESKKNKNWHKQYVEAIAYRSFNSNYDADYSSIQSCQDFYNGLQTGDEYSFLQNAEDGTTLPAQWINFNKIKTKVNLLLGELYKKGYRIDVNSVNKEAKVRKLQSREDARVELRLSPFAKEIESEVGLPLMSKRKFEDEQELEDYYNYSYKEKSEVIMKSALDYSLRRQKWDYEKMALFRDILITNRAFAKVELIDGIPVTRRIDPKYMIWDREATNDFLSDSSYFGEVRYMTLAEAAQKYKITEKQLKESYGRYMHNVNLHRNDKRYKADFLNNSNMHLYSYDNGELKVMVVEAYWADWKKMVHKEKQDSFGGKHLKRLSEETSLKKDVLVNQYKIWRKGVLIGGETIVDWGEVKNQPRSVDNFSDTGCPYHALIPHYLNYGSTSIVEQLKSLQDLKNIVMYQMQLAMSRAGAKGFIYDVAQLPEGWEIETAIKYLKVAGIAFINSAQDEIPASFNQFQQFDMTLSQSVGQYLQISSMIDREMDSISGVNEARQGIVQNSSQAVGVTQAAIIQSSLSTESYFSLFSSFCESIYTYMSGLIKIAWAGKERFSPIIGDSGVDFLRDDIDLQLDDYAVFVEEIPESISDKNSLQQIVIGALQSGSLNFVQAIKILNTRDIDYAVRMLEKSIMEEERKKSMEQQKNLESQMAQAEQNRKSQIETAELTQKSQIDKMIMQEEMKGKNDIKSIITKGKVDLMKQGMKESGDTNRASMKNNNSSSEED